MADPNTSTLNPTTSLSLPLELRQKILLDTHVEISNRLPLPVWPVHT